MSDPTSNDLAAREQQGWVRAPLARFLTLNLETVDVDPDQSYPTVGVLNRGRGLLYRDPVAGSSTSYKKLNRIGPGLLVYSRLKAFEGAITVTPADLSESFASQEFPTFSFASNANPDFFRILTTTQRMWDALQGASKGMGGRRERVKPADFLNIVMDIPPLPVQERIVEVIGAVDEQTAALDSEASTARRFLDMVLAEHFVAAGGEPHRIVDLCSHVVGGVWGSPAGEGEVDRLALGPRIYTPGTSAFVTDGSPVRSFTSKQADTRTVREQDIILERSGGSPEQPVGRVAIAGPGLEPCVPTDFQRLLRVDPEKALPRYVFWRLRHDWASGLTQNYSRRTTGITNLSVKEYIAREVAVPSRDEQARLVETAEAVDAPVVALRAEAARLRQVRAGLLSGLLDRTINIEPAEQEV
ncbi:hypothetical protein [Streptomyces sp. NPDC057623]|uniref:hypothetical protein n=1 Tax=Streptomyces sp. NPDC057623 TaxID=3346187 RepID=UPI003674A1B5